MAVRVPLAWVVDFHERKLRRIQSYGDRAEALEAAGLLERGIELVHQACDAFNRRDLDAFLALCDPDVEFISYLAQVEGGEPYRGHDGVREWWERLHAVFPDFRAEVEQARDLDGRTIARWRTHARGVESDALAEQTVWQVGEYRHGKAIEWRFFRTEEEALEAAGLSE
jgi:ketosteroid isomerase-like protein